MRAIRKKKVIGLQIVTLLLVTSFALGACGRKGALVMPEEKRMTENKSAPENKATNSQEETQNKQKKPRPSEAQ